MNAKSPEKIISCLFFMLFICIQLVAQINPKNITIARDKWGVPHIYAATDAEVAYGLAWAGAEDDFKSAQVNLLAVRGRLAEAKGKEGAIFDFFAFAIQTQRLVEEKYESDVSPAFKKVLEGYAAGINAYAAQHPEEVLVKGVFPIRPHDILQGYVLNLTLMSGVHHDIIKILSDQISRDILPQGSNAIAISAKKTTNNKTFFTSNSHQPLEGPLAWYEAHVESEEGWKMIGANFPGGVTLFLGTTPNLGWTHTVNAPDMSDVYKLEMDPKRKGWYKFDGKWEQLKVRKFKTKVKLGFLKVPYGRKIYESKYGLTLKGKDGHFYSIRFPTSHTIKAAEQWFKMNKAKNFAEFKEALAFQGIGTTNIVYADKEDNIFYIGNANFPYRNPKYQWDKVLPGNTSENLWEPRFYPIDSLAQVLNPPSGWVFNTNNQPYNATAPADNIKIGEINKTMGYQEVDNNRSLRFAYLMKNQGEKISYEDFITMKYDQNWMPAPSYSFSMSNIEDIFNMDAQKYPQIKEVIEILKNWDRSADENSIGASVFILVLRKVAKRLDKEVRLKEVNIIPEAEWVEALEDAQKHLRKHFKSTKVPLGKLQRHIRGEVSLPISGAPEVLGAIYSKPHKKGQYKVFAGESYIQLVQYSKDGIEIQSVVPYGSSAHEESPHYTDQMEMYAKQQTKPMTFDKEKIMREAERIYSPGE